MNRSQRRYGRLAKKSGNSSDASDHLLKVDNVMDVVPPTELTHAAKAEKKTYNRSCHASPDQIDESLLTDDLVSDQLANIIFAQCNLDSRMPVTFKQMDQLQNVFTRIVERKEKSSQYLYENPSVVIPDGFHWQNVETSDEFKYLGVGKGTMKDSVKNIHISDVPRIKVIAEKFVKFNKNYVELRKLVEKIVCVEYDVYGDNGSEESEPIQKMRAYFSVKPVEDNKKDSVLILPSIIQNELKISDIDMDKLKEKQIEIIDGQLSENKPYLEDLKSVLERKRAIYVKKNKSTLDLQSLYKMAKRNCPSLDADFSNTNLLSKAELQEIKYLITKKCDSSVHGISRKTIKTEKEPIDIQDRDLSNISDFSIYEELIRN